MNRPARITETYRHPPRHSYPPVADCTDDDFLDIAARAMRCPAELVDAPGHVQAICRLLVERMEPRVRALEERLSVPMVRVADAAHRAGLQVVVCGRRSQTFDISDCGGAR